MINKILSHIDKHGGGVHASFYCFENIQESMMDGVINFPIFNEKVLFKHAVNLAGFDLVREYFIFQNSWGDDWGEGGLGYLPFDYFRYGLIDECFFAWNN